MTLKSLGIASVLAVAATAFVIGTSPAKAEGMCTLDWKPVCANDHGFKHTFTNACSAKAWGAKIIHKSECGMKPKHHHHHHKAMKKDEKKDEKKK
jgi:hypothetical protein